MKRISSKQLPKIGARRERAPRRSPAPGRRSLEGPSAYAEPARVRPLGRFVEVEVITRYSSGQTETVVLREPSGMQFSVDSSRDWHASYYDGERFIPPTLSDVTIRCVGARNIEMRLLQE